MDEITSHIHVNSKPELRKWIEENIAGTSFPLWVVIFKKSSGKQSITYEDIVEEAICFGLIDTLTKTVDDKRYAICLRIRKTPSNWTENNVAIAKKMIKDERMTPTGLESFRQRV